MERLARGFHLPRFTPEENGKPFGGRRVSEDGITQRRVRKLGEHGGLHHRHQFTRLSARNRDSEYPVARRVVVGVDGSRGARAAVRAVAARAWGQGGGVRVVVAQDLMKTFPVSLLVRPAGEFVDEANADERTQAEEIAAETVKGLRAGLNDRGVTVSSAFDAGDPKRVLVRHAEEFGADCIFTGATGFSNRIERFVLGSVSAAVAARAHCSVEIVRLR